jgi:CRP-like cAMP-binding protein
LGEEDVMLNGKADPEAILDEFIRDGQTYKATDLLYKLAIESAKNKNFAQSEAYRDRLYEVDSMAISRIVEVNEVIEIEKSKAITPDIRRQWTRFFDTMSDEEANAFFFALKQREFDSETLVLQQGSANDRLYLVNQGQLKLTYSNVDKEILINRLGSGDFFGEDTFFSVNVCTYSVKTLVKSRLSFLDRSDLERLKKMHTSLESALKKSCRADRTVFDRLRQQGLDRRAYRRINLSTKVMFQLLSENDKAGSGSVAGELWDVSKGGLSFYFHSKSREAVRRLIGRTLGVRFKLTVGGKVKTVAVTGVVHGVQSHPLEEYSVHIKLNRQFSDNAIKTIQKVVS